MWPRGHGSITGDPWWPLRSLLLFETFVSIRHGGSRPWWCAGGIIRGDVNNIGGTRRWSITALFQLTSPRLVVWKSVVTRTALHASCAIFVPSATMRVQNFACSGIKRGSCWKCFLGYHVICLRYSYDRLYFNWYRASRGSLGDSWAFCYNYVWKSHVSIIALLLVTDAIICRIAHTQCTDAAYCCGCRK